MLGIISFNCVGLSGEALIGEKKVAITVSQEAVSAYVQDETIGYFSVTLDKATGKSNMNLSNVALIGEAMNFTALIISKLEEIKNELDSRG